MGERVLVENEDLRKAILVLGFGYNEGRYVWPHTRLYREIPEDIREEIARFRARQRQLGAEPIENYGIRFISNSVFIGWWPNSSYERGSCCRDVATGDWADHSRTLHHLRHRVGLE